MQNIRDRVALANGGGIPCVGFGTWKMPGEQARAAVQAALAAGYRHIDTATAYGNEEDVGAALAASNVTRGEIFLTSKLWNPDQGYGLTLAACERSLRWLQTDYLDLYLIHWPHDRKYFDNWEEKTAETWRAFEELYRAGKVRAIGVSNFRPHHLETLARHASVAPMADQIECHPGMPQDETRAYCAAHGIVVEGWSPLGSGRAFDAPELRELAARHGKSVAQVCLRWCLQHDVIPLPKSTNAERIADNGRLFDFTLSDAEMARLDALDIGWSGLDPDDLVY